MLGIHAAKAGVDTFTTGCVSARHEIDYKAPLEWRPDVVTIEVWITEVRAVSFNVAYEVKDDQALYARAASKMVPYNLESKRPRRLTDAERMYLTRFLEI
ncbi:acyl-CoA thioesterase [Streptomyces sp. NPDC054802]